MPSRRRLSGKPTITIQTNLQHNNNGENVAPNTPSSRNRRASMKKFQQRQRTPRSTRRRSSGRLLSGTQGASSRLSIGGAKNGTTTTTTTTSAANDIAVEEIRRSTMQAASQNKINLKTANFYYRFIEKIDDIIENINNSGGDDGEQITKFEECGCAVETGAQIYAAKVDETYAATGRFVADLNRNSNNTDDEADDDDDEDIDGSGDGNGEKVKKKKIRSKGNTLDKISNITSTRLESEYDIDPIFAKMSTNMDQGGARGMLLGKLNVENGLNIVFDATAIINTDFAKEGLATCDDEEIDITNFQDALMKNNWENNVTLCPSLEHFYNGMNNSNNVIEGKDLIDVASTTEDVDDGNITQDISMGGGNNDSFNEMLPTNGFIAAPFSPSQQQQNMNNNNIHNNNGSSTFQFGQVIDATNIHITTDGYVETKDQDKIENILTNCPYWKCFVPKSAKFAAKKNGNNKNGKKSKKKDVTIDFANTFVNIEEDPDFQIPKRKTAGMLTAATLKKRRENPFSNMLPEDVHYKPESLRSLYTTERIKFGFTNANNNNNSNNEDEQDNNNQGDEFTPMLNTSTSSNNSNGSVGGNGNDSFANLYGNNNGFSPVKDVSNGNDLPPSPSKLVPYAKTATKFNIKALKHNMWNHISHDAPETKKEVNHIETDDVGTIVNANEEEKDGASFSQIFSKLQVKEENEVSVSMMFLTMLFLSNENTLALRSSNDMNDIIIYKDTN